MWIMLNNAFLSIVHKDCAPDELLVRARRKGDIERVFPRVKVTRYTKSDYLYRAVVSKIDARGAISLALTRIDYSNFKNSVEDNKLHDAYLRVWQNMADLQNPPPYSGGMKFSK